MYHLKFRRRLTISKLSVTPPHPISGLADAFWALASNTAKFSSDTPLYLTPLRRKYPLGIGDLGLPIT